MAFKYNEDTANLQDMPAYNVQGNSYRVKFKNIQRANSDFEYFPAFEFVNNGGALQIASNDPDTNDTYKVHTVLVTDGKGGQVTAVANASGIFAMSTVDLKNYGTWHLTFSTKKENAAGRIGIVNYQVEINSAESPTSQFVETASMLIRLGVAFDGTAIKAGAIVDAGTVAAGNPLTKNLTLTNKSLVLDQVYSVTPITGTGEITGAAPTLSVAKDSNDTLALTMASAIAGTYAAHVKVHSADNEEVFIFMVKWVVS